MITIFWDIYIVRSFERIKFVHTSIEPKSWDIYIAELFTNILGLVPKSMRTPLLFLLVFPKIIYKIEDLEFPSFFMVHPPLKSLVCHYFL